MQVATRSVGSKLGAHAMVVGVLAVAATILSLVLWFHPTAGHARGGILDGVDLRGDIIQILWWMTLAFAAVSTALVAFVPPRLGAARYVLAYAAALGACVVAMPLLDKFY